MPWENTPSQNTKSPAFNPIPVRAPGSPRVTIAMRPASAMTIPAIWRPVIVSWRIAHDAIRTTIGRVPWIKVPLTASVIWSATKENTEKLVMPRIARSVKIFQWVRMSLRARHIRGRPIGARIRNAPNERQNAKPSGGSSPTTARPTIVLPAQNTAARVSIR